MVEKVSKLILMRITEFMNRILGKSRGEDGRRHQEDVKEHSMLFKDTNFGKKKWSVEIPTTGFVNTMPMFSYFT